MGDWNQVIKSGASGGRARPAAWEGDARLCRPRCALLSPDAEGEPRPPAAHLAHVRSLGVLAPPLRSWGASFQERGIGGKEGTEAGESPRPRKGSVLGGGAGQTLTPSLAPALHGVGRGAAAAKPGDFGVQEVDRPRAGVQGRC